MTHRCRKAMPGWWLPSRAFTNWRPARKYCTASSTSQWRSRRKSLIPSSSRRDRLIDRILDTAPVGREGAVAKLRYIADARRCYINEEMEEPLAQVLSAFERE